MDDVLDGLPSDWVVGRFEQARLVVGASGAFVLVAGRDELASAANQAHALAQHTRAVLAHHLSWVPFIDAAVVTVVDQPAEAWATVVPVDLLGELLVEGKPVIDGPALTVVSSLLDDGRLGDWRPARVRLDLHIDLSEPARSSSSTA
jgi:hypothetical protein